MTQPTISATKPVGPGHNRPDLKCHHQVIYGLTCREYEEMRARAGGRCEICKVDEKDTHRGFLVVDHFHGWAPGASFIRGMLCDWCNKSVMQAYDGLKPWGKQRHYEDAAREYERNSWQQPSAVALREMAERTEMLPAAIREPKPRLPRPRPMWMSVPDSIQVPLRRGQVVIATRLRRYLTSGQLERLVELLTEES